MTVAMRILLIGGSGQLGSDLRSSAPDRYEVVAPSHSDADVTDADALDRLAAEHRPEAVIDAAAFHKVERCEEEPERAFSVNTVGALNAARAARRVGARCVYVSTDYVFDGENPDGYDEANPPSPLSVYGVSKAAGEWAVRNGCPDSLVVRASGLFGHAGSSGKGGNFVEAMLGKAAAGDEITVVDDQIFAPSCTRDTSERILLLLERRVPPGVYHVANSGSCSWYGFARETFRLAGVDATLAPRPTGEQAVRRPRASILLDTRSATLGLPPMRPWTEALAWYLSERGSSASALGGNGT